jgi:hypothetical protein
MQDFIMFKKDSFQPVISISLTWETFEQYALWHLILGQSPPLPQPIIPAAHIAAHSFRVGIVTEPGNVVV